MSFTNKVVVITGAATGMGAKTALTFAKLNATLCIIDINEKDLLKIKKECEELTTGQVFEVIADLTKEGDVKKIGKALKQLEKINVLVNSAGVAGPGSLQDADIIEKFDKIVSINLRATVVMTKQVLPALIESKGCIINISSIASTLMMRNLIAYSTSKAGVTTFTKCAAFELASRGVRVNCISPGPVRTNIWKHAGLTEDEQLVFWDQVAETVPLKKCVKVDEIADLVVYLASDKATSITGADFVIDSGMMLGTAEAGCGVRSVPKIVD
ncbi:3-oxoacyl-[acyl-carrier-protein] reductase FabG-like [Epargyreus clarus]|uniref:3-oxoacyl-[acyl-carrier-protein] reductase FabG-like n=1 Tax=Epargyreus clarus TaxID=520877 RepID=UPI003C2E6E0E